MAKVRCAWADTHELFIRYHDGEWGVPVHDDRLLFEMINLEGAQAGLSWLTVLKKRRNYKKAFDNFNAKKIALYTSAKKSSLLKNDGIIRNRLKVNAVVDNAKSFLLVKKEYGTFDKYIWGFVDGKRLPNKKRRLALALSQKMSDDLKRRGFRFVGPTICYAFMQAVGMIDDHHKTCFRFGK
jgi:DNA-3-methyladenine glycosylase I